MVTEAPLTSCRRCGRLTRKASLCQECCKARPSAHRRGYTAQWRALAAAAIAAQPWCTRCGATADLTADHVVPLARGGSSTLDNTTVLCRKCNGAKGAS